MSCPESRRYPIKKVESEFFYQRKDGYDKLHAIGMSLAEMAIEPAYIARKLYASMLKQNPAHAEVFRQMVIDAVTSPVTWEVSDMPKQDLEVYIPFGGETQVPN